METRTKMRIEVTGRSAKLYLNGSARPSLVVDGLKGEDLHGAVALWGYTSEEAYFSNVRITPAAPQTLNPGSDLAGSWEMRYSSDAGGMPATMQLHRDGNLVRPPGREPPHHRHLAQWLHRALVRGRLAEGKPAGSRRSGPRLPGRL